MEYPNIQQNVYVLPSLRWVFGPGEHHQMPHPAIGRPLKPSIRHRSKSIKAIFCRL
jgi:hypothetical protein